MLYLYLPLQKDSGGMFSNNFCKSGLYPGGITYRGVRAESHIKQTFFSFTCDDCHIYYLLFSQLLFILIKYLCGNIRRCPEKVYFIAKKSDFFAN